MSRRRRKLPEGLWPPGLPGLMLRSLRQPFSCSKCSKQQRRRRRFAGWCCMNVMSFDRCTLRFSRPASPFLAAPCTAAEPGRGHPLALGGPVSKSLHAKPQFFPSCTPFAHQLRLSCSLDCRDPLALFCYTAKCCPHALLLPRHLSSASCTLLGARPSHGYSVPKLKNHCRNMSVSVNPIKCSPSGMSWKS